MLVIDDLTHCGLVTTYGNIDLGQHWLLKPEPPIIEISLSISCLRFHSNLPRLMSCSWWRHQMETFSALLVLCEVNSPVTGEFPVQMPVTQSFDVFFDLRLNKRLSKHPRA